MPGTAGRAKLFHKVIHEQQHVLCQLFDDFLLLSFSQIRADETFKNNKMYSDLVYFVTLCGIRFSIYKFAVYELNIGLKLAFMVSESPQKVRDNKA